MELYDITYVKEKPIAFITLNRPEAKNAFTFPMLNSICRAITDAGNDPEIKVIILSGEGDAFSAGGDIKDMAEGKLAGWDMKQYLQKHVQRVPMLLNEVDVPVIASVHGPAFGGGFDMALACDFRIASDQAAFCSTAICLGLAPGNGGAYFLPRLVGLSKALEIHLTGRVIGVDEALRIGLIDRVVQKENLMEETKVFAMEIAQWPRKSIRATKRAVYSSLESDLKNHMEAISSQMGLLSQTHEHQDAVKRFVEKRGGQ